VAASRNSSIHKGLQACAKAGTKRKREWSSRLGIEPALTPTAGNPPAQVAETTMQASTNELLLALRSPTSGWLAAVVCALEEAVRDPNFTTHHRKLIKHVLDADSISLPVAVAAEERLGQFEQTVAQTQIKMVSSIAEPIVAAQSARPKLTLVSNAA